MPREPVWIAAQESKPEDAREVETHGLIGRSFARHDPTSASGWRETWSGEELFGVTHWCEMHPGPGEVSS